MLALLVSTRGIARAEPTESGGAEARPPCSTSEGAEPRCEKEQNPALEVVVTGTRTPEQAQRATLHTGVVTKAEAERRGATNVAEALSGESGLQVNPNAYGFVGSPAGVQMQGLDAERVLILQDGEPVIGDFGGVIDLASFPLTDVKRIEYVMGPTSSLYGTGALGGVVNIVTGAPDTEGPAFRARLEGRSQPAFISQNTASYRLGRYWSQVSVSYQMSAAVSLFEDRPDRALPDARQTAIGLRLGMDRGPLESTLAAGFSREHTDGLRSEEVPGLPRFLIDLPERTDRFNLRNTETWSFAPGSTLKSSVASQWFVNRGTSDRRDSPLDEWRYRDQNLSSAELIATLADGPRTWVFGLRAERNAFEQRLSRVEVSNGNLTDFERVEIAPIALFTGAVYGQLGWVLFDRLTLMPGIRAELHSRFGTVAAPRLSLAWNANSTLLFRASTGRGFRSPSAKEYGFFFDHSSLGYRLIGNDQLKPESSWGASGDVTWTPESRFRLRVGAFANWISELISTDFVGQNIVGVDDYSYVNVSRAQTYGFETSFAIRLDSRLTTQLDYAFLGTRDESTGEPLSGRPAHTVSTAVSYRPSDRWELNLRQRTVSAAFLSSDLDAPGFTTVTLRAAYRISDEIQTYAGVLNALDAHEDPLRLGDQRPVLGRTYFVGVNGAFPGEEP